MEAGILVEWFGYIFKFQPISKVPCNHLFVLRKSISIYDYLGKEIGEKYLDTKWVNGR